MPETARDRMAYMIWCVKNNKTDLLVTGDNHFLEPIDETDLDKAWEHYVCYQAADTMIDMLRSDIFKLVRGGKEGLHEAGHPWVEGIQDALGALGWRVCRDYDVTTGAYCDVEITWTEPHGRVHHGNATFGPLGRVTWPVQR